MSLAAGGKQDECEQWGGECVCGGRAQGKLRKKNERVDWIGIARNRVDAVAAAGLAWSGKEVGPLSRQIDRRCGSSSLT